MVCEVGVIPTPSSREAQPTRTIEFSNSSVFTSFSTVPLRIITFTGLIFAFLSIIVGIWAIATRLFTDRTVPGWASTVIPIFLLGGIQLLSLGIMGEYVSKIYMETKRRPRYIVDKII